MSFKYILIGGEEYKFETESPSWDGCWCEEVGGHH